MNREDAQEYTQSLGQIVAGSWRQIHLARKLGIPSALGLTTEQWVNNLGGYVRLSIPERREAVVELQNEGLSQRAIGEVLGVSQKTVDRDLDSESNDSTQTSFPRRGTQDNETNDSPTITNTAPPPTTAHVSHIWKEL